MRPARSVEVKVGAENNSSKSARTEKSINSSVDDLADLDLRDVWKGEDVEQDWVRCHMLMKRLGRDGRKLELWKRWLGGYYSEHAQLGHLLGKGKRVQKQWTEDSGPLPSEVTWAHKGQSVITEDASPVLEHVAAVLRVHGDSLLRSFIYPDSRAQFLELLGHSGLLPEMNVALGIGWSSTEIDFWSYVSGLDLKVEEDDVAVRERGEKEKAKADEHAAVVEGRAEVLADAPTTGYNDVD